MVSGADTWAGPLVCGDWKQLADGSWEHFLLMSSEIRDHTNFVESEERKPCLRQEDR